MMDACKQRGMMTLVVWLVGAVGLFPAGAVADDWPQWMGEKRDGVYRESGVIRRIPEDGLPEVWSAEIGLGYAGPAVSGGRVFLPDFVADEGDVTNSPSMRVDLVGKERVVCFDQQTGETEWVYDYECEYRLSYPGGPRVTPTVDGDRVYGLGAMGRLFCLDAKTGDEIWFRDLVSEFEVEVPIWGFCGHPLVDGEQLFCLVGGKDSVLVSFDKRTGETNWTSLNASEPGYCPPKLIEAGGKRQLLLWHPQAVCSVDPANGELYWKVDLAPGYGMSINAPVQSGDMLYASGIGLAAAAMRLDRQKPGAEVVWRGNGRTGVYCANSTPQIIDGVIYGADCMAGVLRGVDLETGERLWETSQPTTGEKGAPHGTAFLIPHEDRCFLFNERGELLLARLSREGYEELGRTKIIEPTNEAFGRTVVWSHPAFAGKCVFARNDRKLVCVSIAAP